jgi:phytoene synthase
MSEPAPLIETLIETLPLAQRLALSYAPAAARLPTLALLALDRRLAGIVRHSHEPMLAQLRLSWWREQLAGDAAAWPEGEPLLTALRSWRGAHGGLSPLVDGWETLTGPAPLPEATLEEFGQARGQAFAALARVLGAERDAPEAHRLGRRWALADLAVHVSHPDERGTARDLAARGTAAGLRLSRPLRPLLVLHGLALRRLRQGHGEGGRAGGGCAELSPGALALALRLGLLGR